MLAEETEQPGGTRRSPVDDLIVMAVRCFLSGDDSGSPQPGPASARREASGTL